MLVVPYYNKPNQEGMYQHFKTVAEQVASVILYNVPLATSATPFGNRGRLARSTI